MLSQPRLIRLCTSDTTLYFQSVCNAIFLDASDSFGSMYVVWVKHGMLVGVKGLGRNTAWLTFVWSLSDIYHLEPTTYNLLLPSEPSVKDCCTHIPFYFYWQRQKCWSEAKRTVISTQDDGGDQIRAKKLKMHIGLFARLRRLHKQIQSFCEHTCKINLKMMTCQCCFKDLFLLPSGGQNS